MTGGRGRVQVEVVMRAADLEALIKRRFGGMAKLRRHLDRHPDDSTAAVLYVTALDHADDPDERILLGELHIGNLRDILTASRFELLAHLLGEPGIGVRELARRAGKNPATVLEQLARLEEAGLVLKESEGPGKPATIRPLIQELTIRLKGGAQA